MTTADDVLNIVKEQHDLLNQHMDLVAQAAENQRKAYFTSLRRLLEAHEAAEDAYVENNESVLGHAHRWVEKLDQVGVDTAADFNTRFKAFQEELQHHAETEIKNTMPKVLEAMDAVQLDKVLSAFSRVSERAEPVGE